MIEKEANQKISFHFLVASSGFTERKLLKGFINKLFKLEHKRFETLTYIFCSDQYLLAINNNFLHHNYFTDIITFNLADRPDQIIGEIYISIDRVRDNAKQLGESFRRELERVIFHGALHLCGFKDKSKKQKAAMRSREDYYLNAYYDWKIVSRGTK